MNNFGVIEVAGARTTSAPGWAYVPDTSLAGSAALQPAHRKRARNQPAGLSLSDLSARQEAKIRKELEALDRDPSAGAASHRDGGVAVPSRSGAGGGKHTPNVRKILTSQKTFANHLDDYLAFAAASENNPAAAAAAASSTPVPTPPPGAASSSHGKRPAPAPKKGGSSSSSATPAPPEQQDAEDVAMADADDTAAAAAAATSSLPADITAPSALLQPYTKPPPAAHPGDSDPLLASAVPPVPADDELRALLAAPPLTYLEARARWPARDSGRGPYPARTFCEVCGYWGRVRCMKCGTRVCALDCLDVHREECITRYGL